MAAQCLLPVGLLAEGRGMGQDANSLAKSNVSSEPSTHQVLIQWEGQTKGKIQATRPSTRMCRMSPTRLMSC